MAQISTIASVFIIGQQCCLDRGLNTDIRIGTSATVLSNAICKNINQSGIYTCDTKLSGNYVGLQKHGNNYFAWNELRAYEAPPIALTLSMLSTNTMPDATLANALSFSMVYGQTLGLD